MRNRTRTKVRILLTSLAGLVVLLGLCQLARAKKPAPPPPPEASYHLVLIGQPVGQITNSGRVLAGSSLIEPALDGDGNPVWDSDGDGIADSYTPFPLTLGGYLEAEACSVNEELGAVVGCAKGSSGYVQPVLWTNIWSVNGDGTVGTLVDLGGSHGAQEGIATDINSQGQVVVREGGREHPWSPWGMGLVLVVPEDTDADGAPDTWFEDIDADGNNDLMIDLEGTSPGGSIYASLRINELGQITGVSNLTDRGFVVLPEDGVWFKDVNGDSHNDLQINLGSGSMANDISDGGRIVGKLKEGRKRYLAQWQIDQQGQVNLIVKESAGRGGGSFDAINENAQVVGTFKEAILWENGEILSLIELLDNPENADILRPGSINDSGTIAGTSCWYDRSVKMIRCYEGFIAVPIEQ
ncbi:hypothetical protein ACFL1G_05325 [Planctomycetota bacterium]